MLTASLIMMLEDETVLNSKTITQNGTYSASSEGYTGYDTVSVNVPGGGSDITVESLSATENRTYTAPSGKAYSPVTVNVTPEIEPMTRAEWNALTVAQKQAKGLVGIKDANTGFDRGVLVNGADYVPIGQYIPYSDEITVICEAYADNFDADASSWGDGDTPIQYMSPSAKPTFDSTENAVLAAAYTQNVVPFVDLGAANESFTAYAVMRFALAGSNLPRLISCMSSRVANNGVVVYSDNNDVVISKWGDALPTGITANEYFVVAVKNSYTNSNTADVYIYAGDSIVEKNEQPSAIGRYITIGRTDIDSTTLNAEPANIYMRYMAVVNEAETAQTIEANIRSLYNTFIAGE